MDSEAVTSHKIQCDAVDAVPQTRGRRSIFKDVAKVPATSPTNHFHAPHAMAEVQGRGHGCAVGRLEEAWPTAVAFEFGSRIEQWRPTSHADVHAVFVVEPEFT